MAKSLAVFGQESGRWWEDNPDLVTAYAVTALEQIPAAFEEPMDLD